MSDPLRPIEATTWKTSLGHPPLRARLKAADVEFTEVPLPSVVGTDGEADRLSYNSPEGWITVVIVPQRTEGEYMESYYYFKMSPEEASDVSDAHWARAISSF